MPRLLSVAFTEDAVRARTKTVTRRKGWWENKHGRRLVLPGDTLTLCQKVMGRKPGEPLIRICDVQVVDVRREPLATITQPGRGTLRRSAHLEARMEEGAREFVRRYFTPQGIEISDLVTRIAWRYLDGGGDR